MEEAGRASFRVSPGVSIGGERGGLIFYLAEKFHRLFAALPEKLAEANISLSVRN